MEGWVGLGWGEGHCIVEEGGHHHRLFILFTLAHLSLQTAYPLNQDIYYTERMSPLALNKSLKGLIASRCSRRR